MTLPLLLLPRRRLLPGGRLAVHIGRDETFRRLDDAHAAGGDLFVASMDPVHGSIDRTGVRARVATLLRTPAEKLPGLRLPPGTTDDSCELWGLARAVSRTAIDIRAREVELESEGEDSPKIPGGSPEEEALIRIAARVLEVERERPFRYRTGSGIHEALVAQGSLERIYAIASLPAVRSATRQRILEADGIARKAALLHDALQDELDIRALERRIARRWNTP